MRFVIKAQNVWRDIASDLKLQCFAVAAFSSCFYFWVTL